MTRTLLRLCSLPFSFVIATLATPAFADYPRPKEITLQEPVTPVMREIVHFHDMILMPVITAIVIFVMALLLYVMVKFNAKSNPVPSKTTHNVPIEIIWTVVPVIILVLIAIPSFRLLFLGAVHPQTELTLKATGNQWYWTYEYPDNGGVSFSSYMVKKDDLKDDQKQLLSTDEAVVLPVDTNILIQVTASDVLHAFAVPAFGIKTDAVPGRLNETWVKIEKPGTYYGQCSELCGKDHGFMPIEVRAVSKEDFNKWIVAKGGAVKSAAVTDPATPAVAEAAAAPAPAVAEDAATLPAPEPEDKKAH